MPAWTPYSLQQKHWKPLDLGLVDKNGLFPGGTIIDGTKIDITGFKRFMMYAKTAVVGGSRTAGTWDLRAMLYDSDGVALMAAPINILTGISRFNAGTTYNSNISFGHKAAAVGSETGNGSAGAAIELFAGPIYGISFHLKDNAAFSGGAADPTSVTINVHLFGQT